MKLPNLVPPLTTPLTHTFFLFSYICTHEFSLTYHNKTMVKTNQNMYTWYIIIYDP